MSFLSIEGTEAADILTGSIDRDFILGLAGNDSISGLDGDDVLDGGSGADTMVGGLGDDVFYFDSANDVVIEDGNSGSDLIYTYIEQNFSSLANVENFVALGSSGINITGNGLDNVIIGNSGANRLTGGGGNDTLDGQSGADVLTGGLGDDVYVVDHKNDKISEKNNQGYDTVKTTVSFSLASFSHVEVLEFTGSGAFTGTGNSSNNLITGGSDNDQLNGGDGNDDLLGFAGNDALRGGNGNDTLDGGLGDDSLSGEAGADTLIGGDGNDRVFGGSEADLLEGDSGNDVLTGDAGDDTIHGGDGNDVIQGGTGRDSLYGHDGDDFLLGGVYGESDPDVLVGGQGNDTYEIYDISDQVIELIDGGFDTVRTTLSYVLPENVEVLELLGSADNQVGTGNAGANVIIGTFDANTLDGAAGADTLIGGSGDDTYVVDDASDVVVETDLHDQDLVLASISYVLADRVEALAGVGDVGLALTGNALDNDIVGTGGQDTLDGGAGADTLTGGGGDDVYLVDAAGDLVVERADGGADLVRSSISWTIGDFVEHLELTGAEAAVATGNALDNRISGNTGANTLDGGSGGDTLIGGDGDDVYRVDSEGDLVVEAASQGLDTVHSSVSHGLSDHVERLILTGVADIEGTGNAAANAIVGNDGDNTIAGGGGDDTLTGGAGTDSFVVEAMADRTVTILDLQSDERIVISDVTIGSIANDSGQTLEAGQVAWSSSDGLILVRVGTAGAGADMLIRIQGEIDGAFLGIDETDSALILIDDLPPIIGSDAPDLINATNRDDMVRGLNGNDTLRGFVGADTLDGGRGADTLVGGVGDDVYIIDDARDRIVEVTGGGHDELRSWVSTSLPSHVETLRLMGTTNLEATGSIRADIIIGNVGSNVLTGGAGNDLLTGGGGADVFMVSATSGTDTITDFGLDDTIRLSGLKLSGFVTGPASGLKAGQIALETDGTDTILYIGANSRTGADAVVRLTGTAGLSAEDFTIAGSDIERVQPASGASARADSIDGTDAQDHLLGLGGNDRLTGLGGDDCLDGGVGADVLAGGDGNDTYVVDSRTDRVIETTEPGAGDADVIESWVDYRLPVGVEVLRLMGTADLAATGSAAADRIFGNGGDNTITGNGGDDTLSGGAGSDVFVVGSKSGADTILDFDQGDGVRITGLRSGPQLVTDGDAVTLSAGEIFVAEDGTDIVLHIGLDRALGADISVRLADVSAESAEFALIGNEIVWIKASTGETTKADDLITRTDGNDLLDGSTGNDQLYGFGGTDTLDGGIGADTLVGGAGDDTYIVDSLSDVIVEAAEGGVDTIRSTVSLSLGKISHVERLQLVGSANTTATGSDKNDVLIGNDGHNTLNGGAGDDTLTGGGGADSFTFAARDAGSDIVTDFGIEDAIRVTGVKIASVTEASDASAAAVLGKGHAIQVQDGDDILVSVGTDSVQGADLVIRLLGAATLFDTGTVIALDTDALVVAPRVDEAAAADGGFALAVDVTGRNQLAVNGPMVAVYGLGGTDVIAGGNGTDLIDGGGGADRLTGGMGNDTLNGGQGNDTLIGANGDDVLNGGIGSDSMNGGAGDDQYSVDSTGDRITELNGGGRDHVTASVTYTLASWVEDLTLFEPTDAATHASERIAANLAGTGNLSANRIVGNSGDNGLRGESGNDTLVGNAGNDTLTGGTGNDLLTGGQGADIFVFSASGNGVDRITDFELGDTIRVTQAGFQGLVTLGGPTSLAQYQVRAELDADASVTTLFFGLDVSGAGDATPELVIELDGLFQPDSFGLLGQDIVLLA